MPRNGISSELLASRLGRILDREQMREEALRLATRITPEEDMEQTIAALEAVALSA